MLKGVNKHIIEINETGSEYFERALIFVKPQYNNVSRHHLEMEAGKMIDSIIFNETNISDSREYLRKKKIKKKNTIAAVVTLGFISIIMIVVLAICLK